MQLAGDLDISDKSLAGDAGAAIIHSHRLAAAAETPGALLKNLAHQPAVMHRTRH
jgi:hypothetical protein